MKRFVFFHGYQELHPLSDWIDWDAINRLNNLNTIITPNWESINYTITTTPSYGTFTIPYNGTVNTATGFSLTTSNPNGTTYTTGGFGGALTTNTAIFTSKFM